MTHFAASLATISNCWMKDWIAYLVLLLLS